MTKVKIMAMAVCGLTTLGAVAQPSTVILPADASSGAGGAGLMAAAMAATNQLETLQQVAIDMILRDIDLADGAFKNLQRLEMGGQNRHRDGMAKARARFRGLRDALNAASWLDDEVSFKLSPGAWKSLTLTELPTPPPPPPPPPSSSKPPLAANLLDATEDNLSTLDVKQAVRMRLETSTNLLNWVPSSNMPVVIDLLSVPNGAVDANTSRFWRLIME